MTTYQFSRSGLLAGALLMAFTLLSSAYAESVAAKRRFRTPGCHAVPRSVAGGLPVTLCRCARPLVSGLLGSHGSLGPTASAL